MLQSNQIILSKQSLLNGTTYSRDKVIQKLIITVCWPSIIYVVFDAPAEAKCDMFNQIST